MNRNTLLSYIRRDIARFGECHLVNPIQDSGFDYGLLAIYDINGEKYLGLGDSINGPLNATFLDIESLSLDKIEDIRREQVRQILSAHLADTDENLPVHFNHDGPSVTVSGMSHPVNAVFQQPGDGTIWFIYLNLNFKGEEIFPEANIDDLSAEDLESLLQALLEHEKDISQCGADPEDLMQRTERIWERITDSKGMNVSYCESTDVQKFNTFLEVILGRHEDDPEGKEQLLQGLRFFAENDALLPTSLKKAPLETILEYITHYRKDILRAIEKEIKQYENEYD